MRFLILVGATSVFAGCSKPPEVVSNVPVATPAVESPHRTAPSKDAVATNTVGDPAALPPDTSKTAKPQALSAGDDQKSKRIFPLTSLAKANIVANGHKIPVWVMDTADKQEEGLMWVQNSDIPNLSGMIFVFPEDSQQSFWMQNTLIPLDIVYINSKKKLVNVVHGKALDETSLPSKGPAKYVVELKAGDAAKLGLKPGTTFTIPDSVKTALTP